jgi:hypothetical protein
MDNLLVYGAIGFGAVVGWITYYTNRHRTDAITITDLGTIVGVIGGGAITALFEEKTQLFGAYSIGLAVGFFGYYFTLRRMVSKSDNFDDDFFLDGRRKAWTETETGPTDENGDPLNQRPMFANLRLIQDAVKSASSTDVPSDAEIKDALASAQEAANTIEKRLDQGGLSDATEVQMDRAYARLLNVMAQLRGLQRLRLWTSPEAKQAIQTLDQQTKNLKQAADKIKSVTESYKSLTAALEKIAGVIKIFV